MILVPLIGVTLLASSIIVDATDAIYDAGSIVTLFDGTEPESIKVIGHDSIYFTVTGSVRAHPALSWAGPDGNKDTLNDTEIDSFDRFSGIVIPTTLPLVGVFYNKELDNLPWTLNYYDLSFESLEYSPDLNQIFFIGDGYSNSGIQQDFKIPLYATHLYLGLADASYFTGTPGAYSDNEGSFNVDYTMVPTPHSVSLFVAGLMIASRRNRNGLGL